MDPLGHYFFFASIYNIITYIPFFWDYLNSAYYFKSATDPSQADVWLIDLQSGGQCYSKETCDDRDPSMKSSNSYGQTISKGGIFDDEKEKSPFFGSNKVFIPYCSSDGWIGDAPASEETWGYEFRGQRIIRATLMDLWRSDRMGPTSQVMFSGQSAGARGMMNNVDFLSDYLPINATVLGVFLDSPYYIDIEPYTASFVGFQNETIEIYNRYNVGAVIPEACAQRYTDESGEGWKCIFGEYRMPFVKTPYLLIASQYDAYQLSSNIGEDPQHGSYSSADKNAYAEEFAAKTESALLRLAKDSAVNYGIFSWACYNHAVSESSAYYTLTANAATQNDATAEFLTFALTETETWIETCSGVFCGTGC